MEEEKVIVALLLVGAPPIAVISTEVEGVDAATRSAMMAAVVESLEAATGRRAALPVASSVDAARLSTQADLVLTLGIVGGSRLARIKMERHGLEGLQTALQLDVPMAEQIWRRSLRGAVLALFPPVARGAAPPPPALVETSVPDPPQTGVGRTVAWVTLGGGVGVAGGAILLRVLAEQARDDAVEAMLGPEREDALSRSGTLGTASSIGFGAAAAIVSGALVYLLVTSE